MNLDLNVGERIGIVGESGAGKSLMAFSILGLLNKGCTITKGEINFFGQNILDLPYNKLKQIRGKRIAIIFQDPAMALNPVLTIGTQMLETLKAHNRIGHAKARDLVLDALRAVSVPSPEMRFHNYPHELSGGLKQRVVIATALLCDPHLVIADEPTTALDVTIQADIMALLIDLCEQKNMALMLISHDLAIVAESCQNLAVMYAGKIVEQGAVQQVINNPYHPYTLGLLDALPQRNERGKDIRQIHGQMPQITNLPNGCSFHPRCLRVQAICKSQPPRFETKSNRRSFACYNPVPYET